MSELLFVSPSLYGMRTKSSLALLKAEVEKQAPKLRTDWLDLAGMQVEFFDGRDFESYNSDTKAAIDKMMAASVLVIGAPVYQGSIPGSLKNLFDLLPRHALAKKGAIMLSVIGSSRYYLAPATSLRPILDEMYATVLHPWLSVEESSIDILGNTRDADLLVRMQDYARKTIDFSRNFIESE